MPRVPRSLAFPSILAVLSAACSDGAADTGDFASSGTPAKLRAGTLGAPPSILLVTIDTLRRDHLGCYGYFRDTSPRIDQLAEESVLFERALATMATTYPSHLSMLTGLYAHEHGRTSNPSGVRKPFASSADCASVAAVLREGGYRTGASVSSMVLARRTGINDGFQRFRCPSPKDNPRGAADTTDIALQILDEIAAGDEPFFLWVHYWDTHEPNEPQEPFASMFESGPELSAWIAEKGIDLPALASLYGTDARVAGHFFGGERHRNFETPEGPVDLSLDQAALEDLWNRYDADVRTIDSEVGRLLDELEGRGLADRTIVALTADHGQALGDNLSFGHGRIYDVNVFVPLLLRLPGGVIEQPCRVPDLVSLVDMMPTILARFELRGLEAFRAQATGTDVLSGDYARFYALTQQTSEFHGGSQRTMRCALLADRWKYVFDEEGGDALYDLEGLGEGVDVTHEREEVASALRKLVTMLVAERQVIGEDEADPEDEEARELIENLRDLGYVGDE